VTERIDVKILLVGLFYKKCRTHDMALPPEGWNSSKEINKKTPEA